VAVEPPTPAEPVAGEPTEPVDSASVAAAASLRNEAIAQASAGQFQEAYETLLRASALADDPLTRQAMALLETHLVKQGAAERERAAEYAQAVRRAQRAMMVQTHLDGHPDDPDLQTLRDRLTQFNQAFEGLGVPDDLRNVPLSEADLIVGDSVAALDEATAVLAALTAELAEPQGEYETEFLAVAEQLAGPLARYRQAWADADAPTPSQRRASARAIRQRESDLAYAMADLDVMVTESPWRVALMQAALASKVAAEEDQIRLQGWYQELVTYVEQLGQSQIDRAEWVDALSAYSGLSALAEDNALYKEMTQRVRKHVRVLGLYGRSSLLSEMSDEPDFEPDPEDTQFWQQLVDGITEQMVRTLISRIRSYYVAAVDYSQLVDGALTSIQVLADTPQAAESFPTLADEPTRQAFRDAIEEAMEHFSLKAEPLDHLDLLLALKRVLDASELTVGLPANVLCMEFTDGFLAELDEFSQPIWPHDVQQFNKMTQGEFTGVGIQVTKEPGEPLKVVTPLPDTPAFNAGIQMGDEIVAVDDVPTADLDLEDIIDMIVGEKGTTVVLRVRRRGTVKAVDIPVVRDVIKIASVKGWRHDAEGHWDYMLDPEHGIGYIRVVRFSRETDSDVLAALSQLRRQGVRSVILDMRLNPGGLLREATRTVNEFVAGGQIVVTRGRNVPAVRINATSRGRYIDGPLVVLVDENAASASEIVSGALQDLGRAVVIGQRSYGKGSVQQVLPIASEPNEALLKLTAAYYYVGPSEILVHRRDGDETWGVEPDIQVEMTPQQLKRWLEIRQQTDLLEDIDPSQLSADLTRQFEADIQLSTAVTLLRLQQLETAADDLQAAADVVSPVEAPAESVGP
jgi:carboxyl-terminal processing protease